MLITSIINGQSIFDAYANLIKENTQSYISIDHKVDSLLSIAEKENVIEEAILIAHDFSIKHFLRGNYDSAIIYAAKDVSYYEKRNAINEAYSNAIFNLSFFQRSNQEYDKAIIHYNKVIALNNNPEKVGRAYCDIGLIYKNQDDYYKAITFLNQGITVLEKHTIYQHLYHAYINIAQVYDKIAETNDHSKKNYKKELDYINKALELKEILSLSPSNHIALYNTVANYYNSVDNYDFENAKSYYTKSLEISKEYQDSSRITILNINIGNLFIK